MADKWYTLARTVLERSDLLKKRTRLLIYLSLLVLILVIAGAWFFKNNLKVQSSKNSNGVTDSSAAVATDQIFDKIITESHFKGTALLVKQGQTVYQQCYGYADAEKKQDNHLDSLFPIASLQKIITGAVIVDLLKDKKLKITDTLSEFYPDIDLSDTITIQQLLTHTSGIMMDEIEPAEVLTNQSDQLDFTLENLIVSEDKEFFYTNANYTLLAGIISQITDENYEKTVQEKIIEPLALKHTYFWDTLPKQEPIMNSYYYSDRDYEVDPFQPNEQLFSSLLGAGNMYMSAADFSIFIQSLTNGKLFSKEIYEQFAEVNKTGYQAGIFYFDDLQYSQGNLGGFNTVMYGDQDNQNLVILFANQAPSDSLLGLSQSLYNQLVLQND